jgi:excisionase family DNA binding protein
LKKQLLTVSDVADELGVSERTVRRRIHNREIKALKLGDGPYAPVRVERAELDRYLNRAARRGLVQRVRWAIDEHKPLVERGSAAA